MHNEWNRRAGLEIGANRIQFAATAEDELAALGGEFFVGVVLAVRSENGGLGLERTLQAFVGFVAELFAFALRETSGC